MRALVILYYGKNIYTRSLTDPGYLIIGLHDIARDGLVLHVAPYMRILILALVARPGFVLSVDSIVEAVFGHRADGGPLQAASCIRVYMYRVRELMAQLNYHFLYNGNRGYSIEAMPLRQAA